jgi:hypothetical protein
MAKDYIEERATRSRGASETRGRRTAPSAKPYDHEPLAVHKLYQRGEYAPFNKTGGDGLVDQKRHDFDVKIQKPQFAEDQHGPGYNPDVPETSYLRGGGKGGESRPYFDRGKYDIGNQPGRQAKGGSRLEATGADCKSSPFSAAGSGIAERENDYKPIKLRD